MIKLFGKFQLIAKNVKTGKITDTGWIDNLVLNNCFNFVNLPEGNALWRIELGTGSTTPTVADTSLETFLVQANAGIPDANKAGSSTSFSTPIYSTSAGWEVVFPLGAVVGNVSEIGVAANTNLFTRALITDGAGDPTTITLGANDILTVNYRMGYEMDTSHPAGAITVDFDGTSIDLTAKWIDLGKGVSNANSMNGHVLPYMISSWTQQWFWVIDTLPSDPLSDINGGTTPVSYLTPVNGEIIGGTWPANMVSTGGSWTKEISYTSSAGEETGNWNGVAVGGKQGFPIVLFEFNSTFVKAANQQVIITVKYSLQRA